MESAAARGVRHVSQVSARHTEPRDRAPPGGRADACVHGVEQHVRPVADRRRSAAHAADGGTVIGVLAAAPAARAADEVRRALPRGTGARSAGIPLVPHAAHESAVAAHDAACRIGWRVVRAGDADGDYDRAARVAGEGAARLTRHLAREATERLRYRNPATRSRTRYARYRTRERSDGAGRSAAWSCPLRSASQPSGC